MHYVALAPDDQDFAYARRAVRRLCRETGTTASEAPGASAARDVVPEAFSAADPQAEAEEIARRILDLARAGVRFHNIAIFHRQGPAADQRLAAALQRAEIPVYRARGLSLRRTAAGRATRQLLRLLWDTPTRSTLLELLANPAIKREIDAKPILWERISRSAGLVSEWDRMSTQLRTYIEKDGSVRPRAAADSRAAGPDQGPQRTRRAGPQRRHLGRRGAAANRRAQRVDRDALRSRRARRRRDSQRDRQSRPARRTRYRPSPTTTSGAPPSARWRRPSAATPDRSPPASTSATPTAPAAPCASTRSSSPAWSSGPCPRCRGRTRCSPIRSAATSTNSSRPKCCACRTSGPETDRLAFQLICQAAREHLTLSWARRSSTVGAPSRPSPLLLSAVGGLAGLLDGPDKLVAEGRIDHLPATVSGAAGPRRRRAQVVETTQDAQEAEDGTRDVEAPLRAIDEADLHLALLTTPGVEAQRLLPALWAGAERALAARLRRNAQTFTEYDGVISLGDEQVAPEHWSASALQRYATCPYRYFLGNVLRLNAVSEPGDDAEISPLERGSLIHRILERWVRGWLEATQPQALARLRRRRRGPACRRR